MRWLRRSRSRESTGPFLDTVRARQLAQQAKERARGAQREVVVTGPLVLLVLLAYAWRVELFGMDRPIRIAAVIALVILGWIFASALGRALAPVLFRRLDPGTAGTTGFLIRLFTIAVAVLVALRVAGLRPGTLATGGAVTAVLFGLASQQTLGNLFAGTVLLSSQPFRLGDRIRLNSGALGDDIEGRVSTLGLLYTTLTSGRSSVLVPNSVVLSSAITPLREPDAVDLHARLRPGVNPSQVQDALRSLSTPTRVRPHVELEAVDTENVMVHIEAVPASDSDGPKLADEMLAVLAPVTHDGSTSDAPEEDEGRDASPGP